MADDTFIVVALHEMWVQKSDAREDKKVKVCLGLRIGKADELPRLMKRLVHQVRDRYPEIFAGMKPKQVEAACEFAVYGAEPDARGFPKYLGGWQWQ